MTFLKRFAGGILLGALLGGCAGGVRRADRVEVEVRHSIVGDASASAGPEARATPTETVVFEAQAQVLAAPSSLSILTKGRRLIFPEESADGAAAEAPPEWHPVASSTYYDYGDGSVWFLEEGGSVERRLLSEVAYEEKNRERQERTEFLAQYLQLPWLRQRDYVEVCWGDLRVVEGEPAELEGREVQVRYLAVEPGEFWEVILAPADSPLQGIAFKELCLAGALGLSTDRARLVLQKVGGMPRRVKSIRVVPEESREFVSVTTFLSAREAEESELSSKEGLPPETTVAFARVLEAKLVGPQEILSLLRAISRGEAAPPELVTVLGLCLRLERRLRPESLEDILPVCAEAGDTLVQVELARVALRLNARQAWVGLRPLVIGASGLTAMNVVEALLAEASPLALPATFHVLTKKQEYADVDAEAVQGWALRHIRTLSGVSPRALLDAVVGSAQASDGTGGLDDDLDFWLRWWDREKARFPTL